jgi:hypothetical protein
LLLLCSFFRSPSSGVRHFVGRAVAVGSGCGVDVGFGVDVWVGLGVDVFVGLGVDVLVGSGSGSRVFVAVGSGSFVRVALGLGSGVVVGFGVSRACGVTVLAMFAVGAGAPDDERVGEASTLLVGVADDGSLAFGPAESARIAPMIRGSSCARGGWRSSAE